MTVETHPPTPVKRTTFSLFELPNRSAWCTYVPVLYVSVLPTRSLRSSSKRFALATNPAPGSRLAGQIFGLVCYIARAQKIPKGFAYTAYVRSHIHTRVGVAQSSRNFTVCSTDNWPSTAPGNCSRRTMIGF